MKGLLRCDARTDLFLPLEGLQNEPRNPLGLTRMDVYGDNVGGGRSMDHQRALLDPRARARAVRIVPFLTLCFALNVLGCIPWVPPIRAWRP